MSKNPEKNFWGGEGAELKSQEATEVFDAKKVFGWFSEGKIGEHKNDLEKVGLTPQGLEKEINESVIGRVRGELEGKDLEMIGQTKSATGRIKTSVFSETKLNYVIKVVDDLSPYVLAEMNNIRGMGTNGIITGFAIVDNLKCKIGGKETVIPEAVLQIKTTPLEQKFEELLEEGNLSEAKNLMEKFVKSVKSAWERGFQFDLSRHFTKDYGVEASGIVTCFDPVIQFAKKPNIHGDRKNIYDSLEPLRPLKPQDGSKQDSSEFVDFANELVEEKLTPEALDKIWKTEKGGKNVFIPDEEVAKKTILDLLKSKPEREIK